MSTTFVPSTEPLSNRDKNMLARAITVAKTGTCKQKHGAVLYQSGKVLAVGINTTRNEHPTMEIPKEHYTTHAEMAVLRAIPAESSDGYFNIRGATLYIARVNRVGNPVFSAPCTQCMNWILSTGIKRVVFTA